MVKRDHRETKSKQPEDWIRQVRSRASDLVLMNSSGATTNRTTQVMHLLPMQKHHRKNVIETTPEQRLAER
ncbi:hypothetical protein JHW46_08625 [Vibrio splendidus]|nr:hypothetical protein [Vibrio splendidus]